MSRDHKKHAPQQDVAADATSLNVPQVVDSADAATAITEFADTGKGAAKDMPRLIGFLSNDQKTELFTTMAKLAPRMSGDQFIACAQAYDYAVYFTVEAALDNAKPPASDASIRRYLRSRTESEIIALQDHHGVLERVKKLLPGPLCTELPQLAQIPSAMRESQLLVKWFVESTDPAVAAVMLAGVGSAELATTLDALDQWSWLDKLKVAPAYAANLRKLASATKNAAAQAKITALLKTMPAEDDEAAVEKMQSDARTELVKGKHDADELLDLGARAITVPDKDEKAVAAQLAGKSAADIMQFAVVTRIEVEQTLPHLLAAPDVTGEHVRAVLQAEFYIENRCKALKNDRLRKQIRSVIGRSVALNELFVEGEHELAHEYLAGDEAMRQWAYESKDPRALLWLAAGSVKGVKQGMRSVQSEKGFDWVTSLPPDADRQQLRRFVLNCKNAKAVKHVKTQVLHDRSFAAEGGEWDAEEINPDALGHGDVWKFQVAARVADVEEEAEIVGRIIDLEPNERADVVRDASLLRQTLAKLSSDHLVRAVYALSPSMSQLLGAGLTAERGLLSYFHSRSAAEEHTVTRDAGLTAAAAKLFLAVGPFTIFPSLLDPTQLAASLAKNSKLLGWIFEDAEPNQALAVLSKQPARAHVADAIEADPDLMRRFPKYKSLMPDAKAGFDAIAKDIDDDEAREDVDRYQHGKLKPDAEVRKDGEQIHDAADGAHLWDAIDRLGAQFDMTTALSLIRTYPSDQIELLSGRHAKQVGALRKVIGLAPQHVFTQLSIAQILSCPDAAKWLFEMETHFTVLVSVASNSAAIKQLGRLVETGQHGAAAWLASFPQGMVLEPTEREVLDEMCRYVKTDAALRRIFEIRFGVAMTDGFDVEHTKQLWSVLRRLPPAQINQQAIEHFDRKPSPGAAGYWKDPDVVLSDDKTSFEGGDDLYDNASLLTEEQVKKLWKLDDATFKKWLDPAHPVLIQVGTLYKMKAQSPDKFTGTVLHEVGHSIDTMLGERTDLVFELGGWKNYGLDDVGRWADDMHGLDGVASTDRPKIIEAWQQALRNASSVSELVTEDHPAMAAKYKNVPLVKAARDGSRFAHEEKREVNGRVALTGNNQGTIASVPKQTADTAPSKYALSAPGEFFAECYAEYYRNFDGTNQAGKGGLLASWIKQWFDNNVDRIELNPQRYLKP